MEVVTVFHAIPTSEALATIRKRTHERAIFVLTTFTRAEGATVSGISWISRGSYLVAFLVLLIVTIVTRCWVRRRVYPWWLHRVNIRGVTCALVNWNTTSNSL